MRARAPGSSANLGPGFDVLAVALAIYAEVEVVSAPELSVTTVGEGSNLAQDGTHLAARVAAAVVGHDRLAISVKSEIPLARGLGSSAAVAVAAAAAAGSTDPLKVAAGFEGHGENAAASVNGGLVAATMLGAGPLARPLVLDPGITFVVLVPDRLLKTAEARRALGPTVARSDAVHNLGRMGLLLAGLADRKLLVAEATADRLHQAERTPLFPEAPELLEALVRGGAVASCWSGAGSSLLGICDGDDAAARVRDEGEKAMAAAGVEGRAIVLAPDLGGVVVTG